jgi:hypothetical protein
MYLPSNTPILQGQRADAARHGAESDARIAAMRRTSACGRERAFQTLVNPNSVVDSMGAGTGLDVAKLQQQTETSRASALLGAGESVGGGPSIAEIISGAPEVVSLNRGGGCNTPSYTPVPLGLDPRPGMPQRAPTIMQGPMYFRGENSTIPGDYPAGLGAYGPPWSDAGVLYDGGLPAPGVGQWLMAHPWLVLALGAAGVALLSRRGKR